MALPTKLATCCYCGARTLLKPTARKGHELACGSCGAPLHEMKWLKAPAEAAEKAPLRPQKREALDRLLAHKPSDKPKKYKRKKRRKPIWGKIMEEAWDAVEDIFD